jgi:uncharacterized coiled-coil protein SlyX
MELTPGELEQRLVGLETKTSFQEAAMSDMSTIIVEQGLRIDRMETTLRALREKVKELSGEEQIPLPEGERPPHY